MGVFLKVDNQLSAKAKGINNSSLFPSFVFCSKSSLEKCNLPPLPPLLSKSKLLSQYLKFYFCGELFTAETVFLITKTGVS